MNKVFEQHNTGVVVLSGSDEARAEITRCQLGWSKERFRQLLKTGAIDIDGSVKRPELLLKAELVRVFQDAI